jgi:adenylate kinase family enzyme
MRTFIRTLIWLIKGIKVYALVGKPGTGKSFRAKLVAQKYGIELILDDGSSSGSEDSRRKSAKKEKTFLGAVKTSLLDEQSHRTDIFKALQKQKFKRILIIGTSDRMTKKIALRLGLPAPTKFIRIEEIASEEEIETAIRSRTVEGKHVIPVPAIEISRNYPSIVYDTIKVSSKRNSSSTTPLRPSRKRSFSLNTGRREGSISRRPP